MPPPPSRRGGGGDAVASREGCKPGEDRNSPLPPPLSIPPPLEAAPVRKSTTVDVISSKISYETVIPVDIMPNAAAFTAKCKPYDIIEGKNPLSEEDEGTTAMRLAKAELEETSTATTPTSTASGGRRRQRSESPAVLAKRGSRRRGAMKKETSEDRDSVASDRASAVHQAPTAPTVDAEHFVSQVTPSPLLAEVDFMPTIEGWAQSRLSDTTPYQIQTAKDAETRVKYILDDDDYEWCAQQDVSAEVLQKSFTFFEWTYVSFLLNTAKGGLGGEDPSSTFSASALLEKAGGGGSGNSSSHHHAATGGGSSSGSHGGASLSPSIRNFITQAKKLNSTVCAVCAKPVHIVTSTDRTRLSELQATASVGLKCSECDVIAHLHCWYLPVLPKHPECWVCDGCYLCHQHRRRAAFTRCLVCGRGGGVLLPYRAKDQHGHMDTGVNAGATASAETATSAFPSSPVPARAAARGASRGLDAQDVSVAPATGVVSPSSPSSPSGESGLCHAVCALAFPELAIRVPGPSSSTQGVEGGGAWPPLDYWENSDSSRAANASVDMGLRPCVVSTRRIPKQVSHCIYCHHATYPTVPCQHPRCYDAMHPSCAAEQHTLECFTIEEGSGRNSGGSGHSGGAEDRGSKKIVPVDRTTTAADSRALGSSARGGGKRTPQPSQHSASHASAHTPSSSVLLTPWTGCSVYCRKHFGYNINRTLGSAALSEKAESQSLKMDLHSLLSGLPMTYAATSLTVHLGKMKDGDGTEHDEGGGGGKAEQDRSVAAADKAVAGRRRDAVAARPRSLLATDEAFFLQGSMPVTKAVRRGPGRPSAAELRQREAEKTVVAKVRMYWQQKRSERRRQNAALASDISISQSRPVLAAALRPELIKISPTKVRLSHFLCLIPEWQQVLVALVEGELPLPDDEYDDVQRYRKASAHTRRSGNTAGLFQRMRLAHDNLGTFRGCCDLVKQQGMLRLKQVEAELKWCDMLTEWDGASAEQ